MMVEWMFEFVAVFVTVSNDSSLTVWVNTTGNDGATFTSLTMTVNVLVEVSCGLIRSYGLLLVTMDVMRFVPGLWVCAGVQMMTPSAVMTMPVGGATSA